MKRFTQLLIVIALSSSFAFAQTKIYNSSSGEMIFSFANIEKNGNQINSNLRWSPVFNFQWLKNFDFTQHVGFFYGSSIHNVGFIYDVPGTDTLKKHRTYNFGIPVGLKIGNLETGRFVYGGYEFELPFHYKEKLFINDDKKDVISIWFANQVNWYTQSVFAGVNFKGGFNIKFKYYIDGFFNKNYTETVNGVRSKPFENFNANVFYISLNWNMFKNMKDYRSMRKRRETSDEKTYSYHLKNYRSSTFGQTALSTVD